MNDVLHEGELEGQGMLLLLAIMVGVRDHSYGGSEHILSTQR